MSLWEIVTHRDLSTDHHVVQVHGSPSVLSQPIWPPSFPFRSKSRIWGLAIQITLTMTKNSLGRLWACHSLNWFFWIYACSVRLIGSLPLRSYSSFKFPVKRTAPEVSREESPSKRCRNPSPIPTPVIASDSFTLTTNTTTTAASDMDSAGPPSPRTTIPPPLTVQPPSGLVTAPRLQIHKPQRAQAKKGKEKEQLPRAAIETAAKAPRLPLVALVNSL